MLRPEVALLVFLSVVLAAAAVLWPRRGLAARLLALRRYTERVRIEDALKHLYNCEYASHPCGVESLAGVLEVPRNVAVRLFARMEARGLGVLAGQDLRLTEAGRTYALHVLRSHRLWERYLADETGVRPSEWHDHADVREHRMTPADAAALAARLGHPRYDPHGDPIPAPDGAMPPASGVALTELGVGELAVIVHLEDEPREVYERLERAGLGPRMRVEVLPSSPGAVRFRCGGREHELEPMVARSVTVEPLPPESVRESGIVTLAALRPDQAARVVRLSAACRGPQRRRLLDLGVVPGTQIVAKLRSVSGDPVAYEIRGALIALRRDQAEWIQVRREPVAEAAAGGE